MLSSHLILKLISDFINTLYYLTKNLYGTIRHPYLTWRRLSREPHLTPSLILLGIVIVIFNFRSPIRFGLPDHPFNIIIHLSINTTTSLIGYLFSVITIYLLSKQNSIKFKTLFSIYIYTYLPTTIWFLATQIFYIILPPPRSTHLLGIIFTAFYLSFSISLLAWKLLLLWLTNQITCQLSPSQNFKNSLITSLIFANFAYFLFKLNLWGIPFL